MNTIPLPFGHFYGNETKELWIKVFEFVKEVYPGIDVPEATFPADQDKGLLEPMQETFDHVMPFFCSKHRVDNIIKTCGKKSGAAALYKKCLVAKTQEQLEQAKAEINASNLPAEEKEYILVAQWDRNKPEEDRLGDACFFPIARVLQEGGGRGEDGGHMFGRSTSQSVEGMNAANMDARFDEEILKLFVGSLEPNVKAIPEVPGESSRDNLASNAEGYSQALWED